MRTIFSRWFLFGLLLGWALTHATVLGQSNNKANAPVNKLRAGLDKKITVDFSDTFETVLAQLCDKVGLPFEIDQTVIMRLQNSTDARSQMQIRVKANNEKASQVLRRLLKASRLTFVQHEGSVLIITEDAAVFRQYAQYVSIDLEDVPLKNAVRDLAKKHGINLVIDPIEEDHAEQRKVTLQLEDTGLETALRLLAEMASLKAVRMGNVMFVTNEEKAKKIREEEKQRQDDIFANPYLDPLPPIGPGVRIPMLPPQGAPAHVGPPAGFKAPVPELPPSPPVIEPPAVNGVPAPNPIPRVIRN